MNYLQLLIQHIQGCPLYIEATTSIHNMRMQDVFMTWHPLNKLSELNNQNYCHYAGLEHCPQKYLRQLVQQTGVSKSSHTAIKLLTWEQFTTIVQDLQPCDCANSMNFCNRILQSVHGSNTDLHSKEKVYRSYPHIIEKWKENI
jgi:hypothetical protein